MALAEVVGAALGSCDSRTVGTKEGAADGPLLGESLTSVTEGRELGMLDGCSDGESEETVAVG